MEHRKTKLLVVENTDRTSGGTMLEKEIRYFINKEINGSLVSEDDIDKLLEFLNNEVIRLLSLNPRWKTAEFIESKRPWTEDRHIMLTGSYMVVRLRKVNGVLDFDN